jgi:hypothetical protein
MIRVAAERYANGETMTDLAREYEVGEVTISRAIRTPFEASVAAWSDRLTASLNRVLPASCVHGLIRSRAGVPPLAGWYPKGSVDVLTPAGGVFFR